MNSRLNWFIPAGVNSTVGSSGTSTSLGRRTQPLVAKKSRYASRSSSVFMGLDLATGSPIRDRGIDRGDRLATARVQPSSAGSSRCGRSSGFGGRGSRDGDGHGPDLGVEGHGAVVPLNGLGERPGAQHGAAGRAEDQQPLLQPGRGGRRTRLDIAHDHAAGRRVQARRRWAPRSSPLSRNRPGGPARVSAGWLRSPRRGSDTSPDQRPLDHLTAGGSSSESAHPEDRSPRPGSASRSRPSARR